jgi:16S rRNA C1402 N4-methylase RsmH
VRRVVVVCASERRSVLWRACWDADDNVLVFHHGTSGVDGILIDLGMSSMQVRS